jgi:hypothetical protein
MARPILMDEFRLSVRVPRGLRPAGYAAVRRAPDARPFRAALARAVHGLFRRRPALNHARVALGR